MNYEKLSSQLILVLRGSKTQPALSRRVGLKSNLVYRWEAGRAFPSAVQFFEVCRIAKQPVEARLSTILGSSAPRRLKTEDDVVRLLEVLCEPYSINELASQLEKSRYIVSRWLSGETTIRLPDFLHLVEVTTLRVLDFVQLVVDPLTLPAVAKQWRRLQANRDAAYELPWSHAVLRVLELTEYAELPEHDSSWIAAKLRLPEDEVESCLRLLRKSGQVKKQGGRYVVESHTAVDTSFDRERRVELRHFWRQIASERLYEGAMGINAYNLFAINESDLAELRELHNEYFNRLRSLVERSQKPDRVILYATQIVPLDGDPLSRKD